MIADYDYEQHPDFPELHRIVLRLSLMSHAPVQGYNFAPSDVGRGERWRTSDTNAPIAHLGVHQSKSGDTQLPTGRIDRRADFIPDYRQKSHVYFARRISRARYQDIPGLLKEAQTVLQDWMKTPEVAGVELERDSFYWKCAIADDPADAKDVARRYAVSAASVYRYRLKYRGLRRVPSAA